MSGLENMSSLARENSEADLQLRLRSPELWRRLDLHRLAVVSSSTSREQPADAERERKLALGLLKDVEPRLLFVAVDFSHGPAGDEAKQKAVDAALTSVLGSSVGPELLHEVLCSAHHSQFSVTAVGWPCATTNAGEESTSSPAVFFFDVCFGLGPIRSGGRAYFRLHNETNSPSRAHRRTEHRCSAQPHDTRSEELRSIHFGHSLLSETTAEHLLISSHKTLPLQYCTS